MTADGIDHGAHVIVDCFEAVIEKYADGFINCPIIWSGSALTFGNGGNMTDDTAGDVAICYTTQKPTTETTCPRGLDECEGEACEEYFVAYSG